MALEPSSGYMSTSPTSSGRASPVPRKWRNQMGSDESPSKDKHFRRYASGVDRSLSLFDTALQEWADYISFLSRLLKSLQAHPTHINAVPSKSIVAKRLAQCLNPSLPSGVHQKALEVYGYIFSMIGKEALSHDLALYLPGLSGTLSFASLLVRGPFLDLLEKYILEVNPGSLRPALRAIILALLPGLEDETSEEFERTLKLLDSFKRAIRPPSKEDLGQDHNSGDEYFWQCFFLATITSNSRRLGALAYLTRNLPKLGQSLSQESNEKEKEHGATNPDRLSQLVTSPEPGLLLRCFAAGLADEQLLIQRGFLDLLVTNLPLHSNVLQTRVKPADLELLIAAATGVVLRREMSLNRRLWTWLLGPDPQPNETESPVTSPTQEVSGLNLASRTPYFEQYGLRPLTNALSKMIALNSSSPSERARPFRICLSLMDRWEIGGLVVPDIFLSIVSSVRQYKDQAASKGDFKEVLRSASMFFDGVESGLIWGEIAGQLVRAVGPGSVSTSERLDRLSLVHFIISNFNLREEEMLLIHIPLTTLTIIMMLDGAKQMTQKQTGDDFISQDVSKSALTVAMDLIELIPQRAFESRRPSTSQVDDDEDGEKIILPSNSEMLQLIKTFYVHDQGNIDMLFSKFSSRIVSELLVRGASNLICQSFSSPHLCTDSSIRSRLLSMILAKAPKVHSFETSDIIKEMQKKLTSSSEQPFSVFTSSINIATSLYSNSYISNAELSNIVDPLVRLAWLYLSASHPKYHVETVRCIWQLQTALSLSNRDIEASICSIIVENDVDGSFASRDSDSGRRFGILWTHTLQDHSGHSDRRSSGKESTIEKNLNRVSGTINYDVMLTRPLFLLLDSLLDERTELFMTVRTWLQSLTGIDKLFHLFVTSFSAFPFLQDRSEGLKPPNRGVYNYVDEDDLDQALYYLQALSNVIRWASDNTWISLSETTIPIETGTRIVHQIATPNRDVTLLEFFLNVCLQAISGVSNLDNPQLDARIAKFHRTALTLLHQILLGPYSLALAELQIEDFLIDRLMASLGGTDPYIQVLLLDVVFAALKLRNTVTSAPPPPSPRPTPQELPVAGHRPSVTAADVPDRTYAGPPPPPASLVKCIQAGIASPSTRIVLDSWINFLTECLPLYTDTIFQIIIPFVESFCVQLGQTFASLQATFQENGPTTIGPVAPESTLISLLHGLEHVLAKGHDRLVKDEIKFPAIKSPDQPQGFFGSVVSGVFNSEAPQARTQTANNRLTVLLSFRDAVRICFLIWSWGGQDKSFQDAESTASFTYTSLRMRNRARRLLEHLFAAEALECLETVVEIWQLSGTSSSNSRPPIVFNLLHVLDGSRPKHTMPAIFNAIYSRTNPGALEASRKSTLTSSLSDVDLVIFLVEYSRSLEDDTMDEIWQDCMTFLRDILANPFPHRQTLPSLLAFAAMLGEKVDNTNFGEQRRMRRELGDLFLRLLTAIFTTKPLGFEGSNEASDASNSLGPGPTRPDDVVSILASIVPNLQKILVEPDRVLAAATTISVSVIGPTFKFKSFPDNVSKSTLVLLYHLSRLPNTQKLWRKDLSDAFNDSKYFSSSVSLVESDWLPLLNHWSLSDKERLPELLTRIVAPTTAGIVFGVGATSARLEADRKTQLNLRRITSLILATMDDNFVTDLTVIHEKVVDLLAATATSSPSSATRADVYMLLRAVVLKTSAIHIATFWPTINAELHSAITSIVAPDHSVASDTYNNQSILQACKLLDTLLCIAPDDFQLHEWLFITDTIDAVYRSANTQPVALVDEIAEELGSIAPATSIHAENSTAPPAINATRKPLIGPGGINDEGVWERKDELVGKVLRPFFSQLSIFAFESTYSMGASDWSVCRTGLLRDVFDEKSIVKAL